jgi:IPT/TIG domain
MSLAKRHIGRRVAGVGVAVALMVLGLQAPAFAAPTVTAISPTSGPIDCVVTITGTGFAAPGVLAADTVKFTGGGGINTVTALFHVVSDTEILTTVPALATDGAITVSDGDTPPATAFSPVFDVTTTAGGCAPTIASFAPDCGVVGTPVVITGTNLLKSGGDDTPPATAPGGGDVSFNPYSGLANHTGAAESPTTLSVTVPANAVTGPIRVKTFGAPDSTITSTTSFTVVTDPTLCAGEVTPHARSISLTLKKHLVAKGVVSSTEDPAFTDCVAGVPVKIQRKTNSGWKNVGSTTTTDTGSYKKKLKDKPGKYRAIAKKVSLGDPVTDVCTKATSPVRKHKH